MIHAVVVAGGKGLRMGTNTPKQFLSIHGEIVLVHTLRQFYEAFPELHLCVVLPAEALEETRAQLAVLGKSAEQLQLVQGGGTRFDSVKNGLNVLRGEGWVLVHDGVRPLANARFLQYCLQQAQAHGSAIPVVPVKDSIRWVDADGSRVLDRSKVMAVQTPQVFPLQTLKQAFNTPFQANFTDEATVYEAFGQKVHLVEGLHENIKITTPEDLFLAEFWLKNRG